MSGRDLSLDAQQPAASAALRHGKTRDDKVRALSTLIDLGNRGSAAACAALGEWLYGSNEEKDKLEGLTWHTRAATLGLSSSLLCIQRQEDPFGLKYNLLKDPSPLGKVPPIDERYFSEELLKKAFYRRTVSQGVFVSAPDIIASYFPTSGQAKADARPLEIRRASAYWHAFSYYKNAYEKLVTAKGEPPTSQNRAMADGFSSWADKQARQVIGWLSTAPPVTQPAKPYFPLLPSRSISQADATNPLTRFSLDPVVTARLSLLTRSLLSNRNTSLLPPLQKTPPAFGGFNKSSPIAEASAIYHDVVPRNLTYPDHLARVFDNPADMIALASNVMSFYQNVKPHDGLGSFAHDALACFLEELLWLSPEEARYMSALVAYSIGKLGGADGYLSYYERLMQRRRSIVCRLGERSESYAGRVSNSFSRQTTNVTLDGGIARKEVWHESTRHYMPNPISGRSETNNSLRIEKQIGRFLVFAEGSTPFVRINWVKRYFTDEPHHLMTTERNVMISLQELEASRSGLGEERMAPSSFVASLAGTEARPRDEWLAQCATMIKTSPIY